MDKNYPMKNIFVYRVFEAFKNLRTSYKRECRKWSKLSFWTHVTRLNDKIEKLPIMSDKIIRV